MSFALRAFHTLNDLIENAHLIFARTSIVQTIIFTALFCLVHVETLGHSFN